VLVKGGCRVPGVAGRPGLPPRPPGALLKLVCVCCCWCVLLSGPQPAELGASPPMRRWARFIES